MLIAFSVAAVAAFVVSLQAWAAAAGIPILLYVVWRRPRPAPPQLRTRVRVPVGLLTAALAILPLLVTFQTIYGETAIRIAGPLGTVVSLGLAGVLWATPGLMIPVCLALLAASALGRESMLLLGLIAAAGLGAVLHLAAYRAIRVVPLLVFITVAGGMAVGVVRFLPWAQPWVEGKAGDLLTPARTARAGLSLSSRLGEIEELGLSREVALRVWSDRPQYLRARVYKAFNGRVWSRGAEVERRTMSSAGPIDPALVAAMSDIPGSTWSTPAGGGRAVASRILLERRPPAGALLAPGGVEFVRIATNAPTIDGAGVLEPWGLSPDLYAVVNRPSLPADAPGPECLDTTAVVDARLRLLADRLRAGADPAERVRRTMAHLESTCTYSLKVGQFLSTDPIGEFVFDKRKGYCEYFASAAAVLLRLQGVPARYVVGYSVRPSNLEGGHFVVREADAHAWVEAWIEGHGWESIDPTPAAAFEEMRAPLRGGRVAGAWERLKSWVGELIAVIRLGGITAMLKRRLLPVIAALVGAPLVVLMVRALRNRRWLLRRPATPVAAADVSVPPELAELLRRLDRHWLRSGRPRSASQAPLEHWESLPAPERIGREIIDAYYSCRYGGVRPTPEQLHALQARIP